MMAWSLVLLPALAGAACWGAGRRVPVTSRDRVVGAAGVGALVLTTVLGALAAARSAVATHDLGGALVLRAEVTTPADVVAILVPAVATAVVAWAAAHEPAEELPRLVGLLVAFVGAMLLLVVAADLLTLLVGFELVSGLSWALIGHHWHDPGRPRAAAHAFNATRAGGLGLFLAAGAAFAGTGSVAFDDLARLGGTELHVLVAGVLVAAAAKSAQGPFAPWLFSAMAGPTPVSALLHSSTMVAAGAYVLVRLHPVLDRAPWFAGTTIALGLLTAVAGGMVALLQTHAKKLLAASTSAQYGLMLVAVGAGYPAVALAHLVVHAVFKAQLFLSAGVAIRAVGSEQLGRMRLGGQLRSSAVLAAVAALALAAVPPLGGAWSKEAIVAAAGHVAPVLAVGVALAGALSAAYATRFLLLAYGPVRGDAAGPRQLAGRPRAVEQVAIGTLAATSVVLGLGWLPDVHDAVARWSGGRLPTGPAWEVATSLLGVAVGIYAVARLDRDARLGHVGTEGATARGADWLGLPTLVARVVVDPTLRASAALARFDDAVVGGAVRRVGATGAAVAGGLARGVEPRLDATVGGVAGTGRAVARLGTTVAERGVDAAVMAVAWVVEHGSADARRSHTGLVHHQFVVIVVGLGLVAVAAVVGR